ncbi:MAG TPA: glycosyltransferase [Candidatus Saccharimonadales bacterium]|nr:glycosyltransferase [Candidatus Saccharimonadales bacterium]
MKVVVTSGGSGGHITPVLAVARELKKIRPDAVIEYISQTGDPLADVAEQDKNIARMYSVRAGKFRRYHGEGLKQLLDVETLYKNLRDAIFVLVGIVQSYVLLGKLRPDVIFTRGSFVSVPVCLAARLRGIPYITHDSDAIPSLANRIIASGARLHAVAMPKEVYNYPPDKTVTVGVPISDNFRMVAGQELAGLRAQLGLEDATDVLLVTGGGNGAQRINTAAVACVPELLKRYPGLYVVHVAGRLEEQEVRRQYKQELPPKEQKRVVVKGFVGNMHQYSAAADVVVTRAGATTMAEFAVQAKACVVVPAPHLTGGHQLKNAQVLADRKAVRLVADATLQDDPHALMPPLTDLFDHPEKIAALGKKLAQLAQPNAAHLLAVVLLEVVKGKPAAR